MSGAVSHPSPGCADGAGGGPGRDASSGLRERKLARTRAQLTEAADRICDLEVEVFRLRAQLAQLREETGK